MTDTGTGPFSCTEHLKTTLAGAARAIREAMERQQADIQDTARALQAMEQQQAEWAERWRDLIEQADRSFESGLKCIRTL